MATGYERTLEISGVGFKAEVKGKKILFTLGFSHPCVQAPRGSDRRGGSQGRRQLDRASGRRQAPASGSPPRRSASLRPPEPYKGKGIKYAEEHVRRKEGKTGAA